MDLIHEILPLELRERNFTHGLSADSFAAVTLDASVYPVGDMIGNGLLGVFYQGSIFVSPLGKGDHAQLGIILIFLPRGNNGLNGVGSESIITVQNKNNVALYIAVRKIQRTMLAAVFLIIVFNFKIGRFFIFLKLIIRRDFRAVVDHEPLKAFVRLSLEALKYFIKIFPSVIQRGKNREVHRITTYYTYVTTKKRSFQVKRKNS